MTTSKCTFVKGQYIDIPKGTEIYDAYQLSQGLALETTKRKITAQVTNIRLATSWETFLEPTQLEEFKCLVQDIRTREKTEIGEDYHAMRDRFIADIGWVDSRFTNRMLPYSPPGF